MWCERATHPRSFCCSSTDRFKHPALFPVPHPASLLLSALKPRFVHTLCLALPPTRRTCPRSAGPPPAGPRPAKEGARSARSPCSPAPTSAPTPTASSQGSSPKTESPSARRRVVSRSPAHPLNPYFLRARNIHAQRDVPRTAQCFAYCTGATVVTLRLCLYVTGRSPSLSTCALHHLHTTA